MKSLTFFNLWAIPLLLFLLGKSSNPQNTAIYADPCPPLVCTDSVTVTMNELCEVDLLPEMLIGGDLAACYENLKIEVFNLQNRPIGKLVTGDYVGQTLRYEVKTASGDDSCWGHITFQDNFVPTITCPDPADDAVNTAYANQITGTLDANDEAFNRRNFSCWLSNVTQESGLYYLDTIPFQVAENGIYTFVLLADFATSDRAAGAIFQHEFYAAVPCQNIIAFTEGGSLVNNWQTIQDWWIQTPGLGDFLSRFNGNTNRPMLRIDLELRKDETYYLATTSLKPMDTGDFVWFVLRDEITEAPKKDILVDETVLEIPWRTKLTCEDTQKITLSGQNCYKTDADGNIIDIKPALRKQLQRTGFPHAGDPWYTRNGGVKDNCGDLEICVTDAVQYAEGTCDAEIIKRTFTATDKVGHITACTQEITIRKPVFADIVLPNFTAYIECDEDFPTDSLGNVHPSATGYPFVKTAFGFKNLTEPFCNLAATYTDKSRVDICDKAYKFIRVWTLYNWCNPGATYVYEQVIKVGDFTPPEVYCPSSETHCVPTYKTGPFDCVAAITIPAPDSISDNCSGWKISVEIISESDKIIATGKKPGDLVSNIPVGLNRFRYRVEDDCKNIRIKDCYFEVLDLVEPVAQCVDFLNVSLGGLSVSGSTRVAATDIDEGSYDGCSDVLLTARRSFADEVCANEYTQLFFGNVFDNLFFLTAQQQRNSGIQLSTFSPYYYEAVDAYFTVDPRPSTNPDGYKSAKLVFTKENNVLYSVINETIDLLCCDLRDSVTVELWVWDDANGSGTFADKVENYGYCGKTFADNYNICWMKILVEDKSPPVCKPPLDISVNCLDRRIAYTSDFSCADSLYLDENFGKFIAVDNCNARMICEEVIDDRDNCGFGTITRVYRAVDAAGNRSAPCKQVITVTEGHNYEIGFPADVSGECSAVLDTVLELSEFGCDLLTVSVKDERFNVPTGECFKVFRTFRVLNWCEYDGVSAPTVISRDEDCDDEAGDEPVYVLRRAGASNEMPAFIDRNNKESDNNPKVGERGATCGDANPKGYWRKSNSVGYWQYTQVLKVYDTDPPQVIVSPASLFCSIGSDCRGNVGIPFNVLESCTPFDLDFQARVDLGSDSIGLINVPGDRIKGQYPKYRFEDNYPIGKHTIEIRVRDGCGNTTVVRIPVEVADCTPPTITCINGLAAELMPVIPAADVDGDGTPDNGVVQLWAEDFVQSASEDCSGAVRYSINRVGADPDVDQKNLVLTCADAGNTVGVEIHAWDFADNPLVFKPDGSRGGPNSSFCVTYVLVQENLPISCGGNANTGVVAGTIQTPTGKPLAGAEVRISNAINNDVITDVAGRYAALLPLSGIDISVSPYLDEGIMNGISTYDLVLISQHILGVKKFDSPYQYIAADVDRSAQVTILDLIHLRKLILAAELRFPNNTSWRFVAKNYVFPNAHNPWQEVFHEIVNINDFFVPVSNVDFVAVKIGDIDFNARTDGSRENKFDGQFPILVQDQAFAPGENISIPIRADLSNTFGYQFTIQFDPEVLELINVEPGTAQMENFGLQFADQGIITASWHDLTPRSGVQDLFTLRLRTKAAGSLHDFVKLTPRYTPGEAYANGNTTLEPTLNFQYAEKLEQFILFQNMPNPFTDVTTIRFYLPEATNARLRIMSGAGQVVYDTNRKYDRGYQELMIDKNALPGAGVYFYTLEVDGWKAVQRMVLL